MNIAIDHNSNQSSNLRFQRKLSTDCAVSIESESSHRQLVENVVRSKRCKTSNERKMKFSENQIEREDLRSRSEIKFRFEKHDLPRLRSFLSHSCTKQQFGNSCSTVHSVYFDTHNLEGCYANLSGISERKKLRVRWYDTDHPTSKFFLELKWRRNRATGKHRFEVENIPEGFQFRDHCLASLIPTAPASIQQFVFKYWVPISHIVYQREHYVSLDQSVRFTIDWNIRFSRSLFGNKTRSPFYRDACDSVILEAKTNIGNEKAISRFLAPVAGRVQRNSKYVLSCQHLGLIQ